MKVKLEFAFSENNEYADSFDEKCKPTKTTGVILGRPVSNELVGFAVATEPRLCRC